MNHYKNYLLLKGGCDLLKNYDIDISRMPIIKANLDHYGQFSIYYYKDGLVRSQTNFVQEKNVLYLRSQIVPLEGVYWFSHTEKRKILDINDKFEIKYISYIEYLKFEWRNYNSFPRIGFRGYYYDEEKVLL